MYAIGVYMNFMPVAPPHTVIETASFISKAAKLMSDDECAAIVDLVAANPLGGDIIKGTHGLRKLRVPLEGRGKRGGARVIYWFHSTQYPAALLWVFAKNEAADLTEKQKMALAEIGCTILEGLR